MTERKLCRARALFDAVTAVDEALLAEARTTPLRPAGGAKRRWLHPAALAACAALTVGMGGWALLQGLRMGGASAGAEDSGHGEGSNFMSYAGPVFPLTVAEAGDAEQALTARRAVTLDFAPYAPRTESYTLEGETHTYECYDPQVLVTDEYVLTNPTGQDLVCTGVYPFAGALRDAADRCPQITVDGRVLPVEETSLYAGPYSGGFWDTNGSSGAGSERWNLAALNSWEQYRALLQSGGYYARATGPRPTMEQTVTVYKFTDFAADWDTYPAATQQIAFMAGEKTAFLTYGINGYGRDDATGEQYYSFFVPAPQEVDGAMPRYLAVLGQDLDGYTLQGYENGGCQQKIDGVSCRVHRYETTLGELLAELLALDERTYGTLWGAEPGGTVGDRLTAAQRLDLCAELLCDLGPLSGGPAERYDDGRLEDILSETRSMERVFYLQFALVIPAGGSVTVRADMAKPHSFDFGGSGSGNTDVDGYDLLTRLGSNLAFTGQTAALANAQYVEIVRQNFGFDPENGVNEVELDPAREHYYMEVRRVPVE